MFIASPVNRLSNASDKLLEFQCPKCAKRLRAAANAAGKRLKCPGCGQPVKVPGIPVDQKVDDDWMQLDLPQPPAPQPAAPQPAAPQPSATKPATTKPATSKAAASKASASKSASATDTSATSTTTEMKASAEAPNQVAPKRSLAPKATAPKDEANAKKIYAPSIFDDDLPELAELEAPPAQGNMAELFGLPDLDAAAPPIVKPKPKTQTPSSGAKSPPAVKEENPRYRIACPSCETPQHVTPKQAGKRIKCPDCFLEFQIPPPPKNWKPSQSTGPAKWSTDLVATPTDVVDRDAARAQANAADILRNAEKELDDSDIDSMYQGDFDTKSFVNRTFGFCFDVSAVLQIVLLSIMFAVLLTIEQFCLNKVAEGDKGYAFIAGLVVPMFFIMISFPLFACAMTHLESVANGNAKVREWPGFNFFDHIGELLLFASALAAAVVPGIILGGLIGRSGGMQWMVISATLLTSFLFFPLILLSMLDNESMFNPFSTDVLTSIRKGTEAWGAYYLKTFVAFFSFFIAACLLLQGSPILTGIAGALLPWLLFFTTQQIGILAFDISELLSLPLNADKNDGEEN